MKKRTIVLGGIGIIILGLIVFSSTRSKVPQYETTSLTKQTVIQKVNVTGKVKPAEALNLAFEQSGKVASVRVKVGDKVTAGATLATLNSADIAARLRRSGASIASARADVSQYQAALQTEQVELDELKNGTRREEVLVSELNVQKAQTALDDAKTNLSVVEAKAETDLTNVYNEVEETLQTAFTTANTAFLEEVDPLFDEESSYDRLSFITKDSQRKIDIERERLDLKEMMLDFQDEVNAVPIDQIGKEQAIDQAKDNLSQLRIHFNNMSAAVDDNANLSDTDENLYRGYVNTAKTSLNTALSSLVSQEQAIAAQKATNRNNIQAAQTSMNTAQKALDVAKQELALKEAGARPEEIAAQEARIKQAQANLSSAQARLSSAGADYQGVQADLAKTVLKAPITGVITKVEAKVGEFISSNGAAIGLISEGDYEIEANIPEVDIAKMAPGKTADVTLDAYGDEVIFKAQVTKIDPAETVVEGVATYKVTLQFVEKDERIKSGMTANTEILVESRENVLAVPARAVALREGKKFVKILPDPKGFAQEIEVETGLWGSEGTVEITKGLTGTETLVLGEAAK